MRVRWRSFELPTRIICNQNTLTPEYGEFIAEPFERGFGHTIGNSLRRILLSAIEGAAVTSVKIEGVRHEFSTLPGVVEDVSDIILNVKKLRLRLDEDGPTKIFINVNKKGEVTGADIITEGKAEIANKNLVIATLATQTEFKMELEARRGRGYVTAEENAKDPQEIGVVPVASIFSPIRHVQYAVENTRVGKVTNYDRLTLVIRTDGTIAPEMALVEASKILRKHLNPFIQYFELGKELPAETLEIEEPSEEPDENKQDILEKLEASIETLDLGARASNCLSAEGIRFIKDLVFHTENDLLKIRNFGKTSLNEIKEKLQKLNLSLGMPQEILEKK
jgi:DNA-directed RNA polymerase subunit alpha